MNARGALERSGGVRDRARAAWEALRSAWAALREYAVRVFEKAEDDNIFVLASGLTFSALLAAVPFLLIVVSVLSLTLEAAAHSAGVEPVEQLRHYLTLLVPVLAERGADAGPGLPEAVISEAIARGQAIGLISFVAFVWFATRLFGSVRAVLGEIFDLRQSRGLIQGKIFDAQMVLLSSVLTILNVGVTIVYDLARARGLEWLALSPQQIGTLERISAHLTALAFIFLLFLLVYKYVPARRVPWRMAVTAAAFTAVCWELLKLAFAFYLTRIADYTSVYGGLATLVVLVVWVYDLAIVFVLGAEVAQVHEMRRVRRRQIEVLE